MRPLTNFERHLLAQPIPALGLPGLPDDADRIDFAERAHEIGYGDGELAPRGEDNLLALFKVLAVLPSNFQERLSVIHT